MTNPDETSLIRWDVSFTLRRNAGHVRYSARIEPQLPPVRNFDMTGAGVGHERNETGEIAPPQVHLRRGVSLKKPDRVPLVSFSTGKVILEIRD